MLSEWRGVEKTLVNTLMCKSDQNMHICVYISMYFCLVLIIAAFSILLSHTWNTDQPQPKQKIKIKKKLKNILLSIILKRKRNKNANSVTLKNTNWVE